MHKWIITAVLALCGTAAAAQTAEAPQWQWEKLGKGIEYSATQTGLFGRTAYITAVRYKMTRHKTRVLHAPGTSADSTSALGQLMGASAAVNGSYFNVKTLEPVTYLMSRMRRISGTTKREYDLRTDGILAIRKRGTMSIYACDTTEYDAICAKAWDAIAAGPVLLKDGKPARESWPKDSFYTKHHPRTLVGFDGKRRAYMIVIDGRFPGEGDGASIDETVQIAQMFGLVDAINLDGGGSCALWTPETGVLSHPYDNHRFDHYGQRVVPNILYIR